jgi:hypothetical protein
VPHGQLEETPQTQALPVTQVESQVIAEVGQAIGLGQADFRGCLAGDLVEVA